ncbi:efflux RND transporter periplasmic adaptor subunit [Pelosinus sp. sgz500959]|uniref:efflux RND transporter periplasmic adaptor subunit n=1 Tax=Pelosinus sp. sgz500959 TaxID=3242472 RepID=UPI00366AF116
MQVSIPQFRKSMIVIIALALIGFLASTIPSSRQRPLVNVTVAPFSTVNKPLYIERAGSSVHATMVPVYSEGAGRVSDVYVTAGQAVKAGQPLVKLEITSGGGETMTASTPAPIDVSPVTKDAYENALKDYNRYKTLYEQGAIPRKQLEAAEARMQAAEPSTQSQQSVAAAPVRKSTIVSGPVTIQASIDGTITGSVVTVGSGVQEGQELMALGSGQEVEIAVALEQNELYFIQLGSQAVIEVAGQKLSGQISGIYPEVKDKQIVSFMAHIKLIQSPGNLLTPGMSVIVRIPTGQEVAAIAVPSQAVLRDEEGQYFVFFASEGKAVRQQVTIGEAIGEFLEVTTAIPQGSLVITSHLDQLKNGDTITVVE